MKTKLKSAVAFIWLIISSFMAYYLGVLVVFTASEIEYWINQGMYNIYSLVESGFGVLVIISYIFTYLSSMIYLCREMSKSKKHLICIPIIISAAVIILSIVVLWGKFELF